MLMTVVSIILNFACGVWLGSFIAALYLAGCWLWALPVLGLVGRLAAPSQLRQRIRILPSPLAEPAPIYATIPSSLARNVACRRWPDWSG